MKSIIHGVRFLIFTITLVLFSGCGENGGQAVSSAGDSPIPEINADCGGDSCM